MGIEIERKFLLANDAWRNQIERSESMLQGYLVGEAALHAGQARASVRVRIAGERAWLNIKQATSDIARIEFDYPLPLDDAHTLLDTLCEGVVEKTRHHVHIDGVLFEVDEFAGSNLGLLVAEVELSSRDAVFPRPSWLGTEVSALPRYYNVNLITHPWQQWTAAERCGTDVSAC